MVALALNNPRMLICHKKPKKNHKKQKNKPPKKTKIITEQSKTNKKTRQIAFCIRSLYQGAGEFQWRIGKRTELRHYSKQV